MLIEQTNIFVHPTAKVQPTVQFKGKGKVEIHRNCIIEDYVLIDTGESGSGRIVIGARSKIKQGVVIRAYDGYVLVGERTSIGEYSILAGHGGLRIGATVIIAGHCYISAANHIFSGEIPIRFQGETALGIRIEDGVWIGARCIVLDGVEIGAGCVVGAGSLVTRSLPSNMICYGAPCKEIGPRTQEEQVYIHSQERR